MQYLELFSHQAATAVVGVGANELRQPCVELQPLVGEPLPDQARRGDYGAGLGFLDNGEIRGVASWMVPRHQVARTSSYPRWGSRRQDGSPEERCTLALNAATASASSSLARRRIKPLPRSLCIEEGAIGPFLPAIASP